MTKPTDVFSGLTAERANELLSYDPNTGILTWKRKRPGPVKAGNVAGTLSKKDPYIRLSIDAKMFLAHRVIWLMETGRWPADEIDHKDGHSNRWSNLREADSSQNASNRRQRYNKPADLPKGVSRSGNKYETRITANGVDHYLGRHDTPEQGAAVYAAKAAELHGEFARTA